MKQSIGALGVLLLLSCIFFSCKTEKKFTVEGQLTSASNEMLYLEHRGLGGIVVLDSFQLKENGVFKFKEKAPENPEFYQLRVNNQQAMFIVDSTETIKIKGDINALNRTFEVENSPSNDQVRQIDAAMSEVKTKIKELEDRHTAHDIDDMEYLSEIDSVLTHYKTLATRLILGNPGGAVAYYTVFQKINNYLVFDPYDKRDYSMFGAVATSWDKNYSDTPRTKHLYDFTMKALKARKQQEQQAAMLENAPIITDSSLPDINLKEVNGERKSLASLNGKVVILDFTVYNSEFSPAHNIDLNKLYGQFSSRGLEIYQISFDSDAHFWKNAANNLPWITVHDPQSVYSRLLTTYNVREIPTAFVVDRNGDIVARVENYKTLRNELEKLM